MLGGAQRATARAKAFQQRLTERHLADAQDRAIVEYMAKKYVLERHRARLRQPMLRAARRRRLQPALQQARPRFWADPSGGPR
jgi:hypothetical protein